MSETTSSQASPRAAARRLPAIRLEHLWALLALAVVGVFVALVPTTPNDFWWHLKVGQIIAREGLPDTNMFAWTLPPDAPFIYQSWLGEWLFYAIYALGGLPLVVFARNMLGLATFALVAVDAQRRSGSWRLAAPVLLLAAAMTLNNLTTRTQNWSWIPCALTALLLGLYADGRLRPRVLIALPAIMLFWVNVHGAFVVGLLLVAAYTAGETLRRLLRQPRALGWERLRPLYLAAGATLLATLANPLGPGIFGYVRKLLGDAAIQELINEWQPPTPRTLAGGAFYLALLALLAAFAFARRRPSISDVLLACGLGWMAFGSGRHVVWFGIVVMPILAQSLAVPRAPLIGRSNRTPGRVAATGANAVLALGLVGVVLLVQPWFKAVLPLPAPYQALFAAVPGAPGLFSRDTPVAAAEHLRAAPCAGRLFNELGYGSYLDWALYPQAEVFIDPRIELYPYALWQDYISITQGRDLPALLDQKYAVACVLLDRGHQPGLAAALAAAPGWQRSFGDGQSEVWRRR
jgi:hypothetical protein